MEKCSFLLLFDELLELEPGTLTGNEPLQSLEGWDSLAVIGFMALADEHLGVRVSPGKVAVCQTVNDLMALCGGRVGHEVHA